MFKTEIYFFVTSRRRHTIFKCDWSSDVCSSDLRLIVDGRVKEYTTGLPHDVTDKLFVIERAYRLNDSLPDDSAKTPRWTWQVGGWISVDRMTGHVAALNLPSFDPVVSAASWYRDYVAYCGLSDDGGKFYMMVSQLGRRKPILKKEFSGSSCAAPK